MIKAPEDIEAEIYELEKDIDEATRNNYDPAKVGVLLTKLDGLYDRQNNARRQKRHGKGY